ncbi:MAG: hypothetical protein ACI4DV_00770 [Lachnospiraceae bacterium]
MKWAVNLYTTEKTKKKLPLIMWRTGKKKLQPNVYFLTIASNEKHLMDIFHSSMYLQSVFQKMNPEIIGIAEDYDRALELMTQIILDVQNKNGDFDVRKFFVFEE